ncbi:MAG TPA: transposase [Usitatibacter sp.]|nr:transposase [Usitatibacter sp.]
MPRRARLRIEGLPLHIVQRGHNRSVCFHAPGDYRLYLNWLEVYADEHACAVHAYALMPNHVHLLLTPERAEGASSLMKAVGQRYAQHVNRSYRRTGSVWESRFRSCIVDSDRYLLTCQRYIELNPVRAGIAAHPADYLWSSHRCNAYASPSELIRPHPVYESLGAVLHDRLNAYQSLFIHSPTHREAEQIRQATRGGFALGSETFVDRLAVELGVRPARIRRGQTT